MRLFHLWFRLSRPMTLGVRALAFDGDGRILLVKHSYLPGWHLCGGGVEAGFTLEKALAAELDEEANVRLSQPPQLLSVHFNRLASRRDHVALYLCENVEQTRPKKADREIVAARFFSLDALPDDITASSRQRIEEYLNRLTPSQDW